MTDSEFLRHEPCPACGSRDNLARYTDGHAYCFGCEHYESGQGPVTDTSQDYKDIPKRQISAKTCQTYDYRVQKMVEGWVHSAIYYGDSGPLAEKIRTKDKEFRWNGKPKGTEPLWGKHLFSSGGRYLVITEGELDTLAYAEAVGCRWPCVSLKSGAAGARRDISEALEWVETFERVILAFDADEPGRRAMAEVAELLTPGKAYLASYEGYKDISELLLESGPESVRRIPFVARQWNPEGFLSGEALWDKFVEDEGLETPSAHYPWPQLDEMLGGIRRQELILFCGGAGAGKTSASRQIMAHLFGQGERVGIISLEESVRRSMLSFLELCEDKPLPSQEEQREAFDRRFTERNPVFYDHWGSIQTEKLARAVRYLNKAWEVDWILLDHVTIALSGLEIQDERKAIDVLMTRLRALVQELRIGLFAICHLHRSDRDFASGAQVRLSDLRGSAALEQLSDAVVAVERGGEEDGKFRLLKNRAFGHVGEADSFRYVPETRKLVALDAPF